MGDQFGLLPLAASGIRMDSSKAMAILGFHPSVSVDAIPMDEIKKAFMRRLHQMLRFKKDQGKPKPKEIAARRQEIKRINEALQHLMHRQTRAAVIEEWKRGGKHMAQYAMILNSIMDAFYQPMPSEEEMRLQKIESERAQELALEIEADIEAMGQIDEAIQEYKQSKSRSNRHVFM